MIIIAVIQGMENRLLFQPFIFSVCWSLGQLVNLNHLSLLLTNQTYYYTGMFPYIILLDVLLPVCTPTTMLCSFKYCE